MGHFGLLGLVPVGVSNCPNYLDHLAWAAGVIQNTVSRDFKGTALWLGSCYAKSS